MCPCCCCYWRTASGTSALDGVIQPKRLYLAAYPISGARKRRSRMNRIGHPDWVKLCLELNCAPNQNTKFPSSADYSSYLLYLWYTQHLLDVVVEWLTSRQLKHWDEKKWQKNCFLRSYDLRQHQIINKLLYLKKWIEKSKLSHFWPLYYSRTGKMILVQFYHHWIEWKIFHVHTLTNFGW